MGKVAAAEILGAVDRGDYRALLHALEHDTIDADGPERAILEAEAALYLDDLDGCEAALARVSVGIDDALQCRVDLIRAEVAFWRDQRCEASRAASDVSAYAESLDDALALELRARLLRAWVSTLSGDDGAARPELCGVIRLSRATGNEYLAGRAAYCLGFLEMRAGRDEAGLTELTRAIELLERTGAERWVGKAMVFQALGFADLGRFGEAEAACNAAATTAVRLGVWRDAIAAEQNAARARLLAGDVYSAIKRLRPLVDEERYNRHGYYEACTLYTLGYCYVLTDNSGEVERVGAELARLAAVVGSEITEDDALLFTAWAASDVEALAALARRARPATTLDAILFLADTLVESLPAVSYYLTRWIAHGPLLQARAYSRLVAARVWRQLAAGRVPFRESGGIGFPREGEPVDYDATVEAVEQYMFLRALAATHGNRSAAARELGIPRSRYHNIWNGFFGAWPQLERTLIVAATPNGLGHERVEDGDDHARSRQELERPCAHLTAASASLRPAPERGRDEGRKAKGERENDNRNGRDAKESGHDE